jgi:hypothetical protein
VLGFYARVSQANLFFIVCLNQKEWKGGSMWTEKKNKHWLFRTNAMESWE